MWIKLVMSSNHLLPCHSLLLLPSIFASLRVFFNESVLPIRWPKYWGFNFNINPCLCPSWETWLNINEFNLKHSHPYWKGLVYFALAYEYLTALSVVSLLLSLGHADAVLKLKLQYFGHLMGRTDSFEKTLMLGKIDGGRRRGWQRMRRLDDWLNGHGFE